MRKELYEQILVIQEQPNKKMYLVRHKISQKLYVMKCLANDTDLSMYVQLMNHPHKHMANVIECGNDEQYSYVIEEYVNGTTLEYEISANRLTYTEKLEIMLELFDCLEHLHKLEPPIIHRDLKPGNIMMDHGHVKLIDFEIARNVVPDKNKDTQIMGSVGYAPPEQYGFAQSDQRSDIYALGIIIKELFTEKKAQITYRLVQEKCLKMDPKDRYFNVKQLRNEFVRCSKGKRARKMTWLQRFQSYQIIGTQDEPLWVKVLVFICMVFSLLIALNTNFEGSENILSLLLLRLCIFIIMMLYLWIPTNSFHLLELTPLHRSTSWIVRFCNGCLIWFIVSCILMFGTVLTTGVIGLLTK